MLTTSFMILVRSRQGTVSPLAARTWCRNSRLLSVVITLMQAGLAIVLAFPKSSLISPPNLLQGTMPRLQVAQFTPSPVLLSPPMRIPLHFSWLDSPGLLKKLSQRVSLLLLGLLVELVWMTHPSVRPPRACSRCLHILHRVIRPRERAPLGVNERRFRRCYVEQRFSVVLTAGVSWLG